MRCAKSVTAGADCESAWHQLLSLSQSHIYSCTDLSSCICVQAGVLLDLLEMPAEGRPALQRRAVKLGLLQVRLQHSLQSLVLSRVYFCCNFLQTLAMSTIVKPMMTPDPALMSSTYRCPGLNPDPALVSQMKQRSQPQDPAQPRVLLQGSVDLGLLICYMEGPPGFTNHSCLLRATVTEVLEAISDMLDEGMAPFSRIGRSCTAFFCCMLRVQRAAGPINGIILRMSSFFGTYVWVRPAQSDARCVCHLQDPRSWTTLTLSRTRGWTVPHTAPLWSPCCGSLRGRQNPIRRRGSRNLCDAQPTCVRCCCTF